MTPLLSAFALAFVLTTAPAHAEENLRPVVVTTGEGVLQAVPDQAFITIAAESRASSPRQAQRQNAEAMDRVQRKLKDAGLPADAIRTIQYDVQPEFDYQNGKQTLRDYVARNSIEVRLDDVQRVGEILDRAVGSGATSISGIRFDLKNRDALERNALRAAVADARARAEAAASGAGTSIDRVVRIEEQRMSVRPPMPMMMQARMSEAAQTETPIAAGQIEVRAMVTLTAALK